MVFSRSSWQIVDSLRLAPDGAKSSGSVAAWKAEAEARIVRSLQAPASCTQAYELSTALNMLALTALHEGDIKLAVQISEDIIRMTERSGCACGSLLSVQPCINLMRLARHAGDYSLLLARKQQLELVCSRVSQISQPVSLDSGLAQVKLRSLCVFGDGVREVFAQEFAKLRLDCGDYIGAMEAARQAIQHSSALLETRILAELGAGRPDTALLSVLRLLDSNVWLHPYALVALIKGRATVDISAYKPSGMPRSAALKICKALWQENQEQQCQLFLEAIIGGELQGDALSEVAGLCLALESGWFTSEKIHLCERLIGAIRNNGQAFAVDFAGDALHRIADLSTDCLGMPAVLAAAEEIAKEILAQRERTQALYKTGASGLLRHHVCDESQRYPLPFSPPVGISASNHYST